MNGLAGLWVLLSFTANDWLVVLFQLWARTW